MSNIVRFPGHDPRQDHQEDIHDQGQDVAYYVDEATARGRRGGFLASAGRGVLAAVRAVLFHLMLWLRPIVVGACHFLGGLGLLAFLAGLLFIDDPRHEGIVWGVGGMSLALSVLAFAYDRIMMMFAPEGLEMMM